MFCKNLFFVGAARAVAALAPPGVECHFVVAACDNMINGKGVVPSDILTASNGKTIEVLNTDAGTRSRHFSLFRRVRRDFQRWATITALSFDFRANL